MLQQDQTVFHSDEEDAEPGNCFATSIACILDRDIAEVPNFIASYPYHHTHLETWLRSQGLDLTFLLLPAETLLSVYPDKAYHTIQGPTPRGIGHCVVGQDGKVVWDPHPSRDGLLESRQDEWRHGYLVYSKP